MNLHGTHALKQHNTKNRISIQLCISHQNVTKTRARSSADCAAGVTRDARSKSESSCSKAIVPKGLDFARMTGGPGECCEISSALGRMEGFKRQCMNSGQLKLECWLLEISRTLKITGTRLPSRHKVQHCQHQLPNACTAGFCWYRAHGQHPNLTIGC